MNIKFRSIWVTFSKIGYHCYPNAPQDVAYLRQKHRHKFEFRVEIEVFHNEREIEYHQFLNQILGWYDTETCPFGHMSCEAIAEELLTKIVATYPKRHVCVEVSEDGECGSLVSTG